MNTADYITDDAHGTDGHLMLGDSCERLGELGVIAVGEIAQFDADGNPLDLSGGGQKITSVKATALAAGTAPTATLANGVLTIGIPAGAKGAPGTAGVGVKSISLTKDTDGNITGGTVTKTDNSTTAITVTTA